MYFFVTMYYFLTLSDQLLTCCLSLTLFAVWQNHQFQLCVCACACVCVCTGMFCERSEQAARAVLSTKQKAAGLS